MNGRDDSVDPGEEVLGQPGTSGRHRLGYGLAALLLIGGATAGVVSRVHSGHHDAQPSSGPGTASGHSLGPAPVSTAPSAVADGPVVRTVPLPDVGPVQLFVRAGGSVAHLDFAAGTVTTTAIPSLLSTGPVAFGVTSIGDAYVRPLDAVPGYLVPSGRAARPLTGALSRQAGLPGPDADTMWVEENAEGAVVGYRLVNVATGARVGSRLPIPADAGPLYAPELADGSGYVLINGRHGTFDLGPDGAHRLPRNLITDKVLAVGAGELLVAGCSPLRPRTCPATLLLLPDGGTAGSGFALPVTNALPIGVIAPDGRTALVYQPNGPGQLAVRLVNLSTGRFLGRAVAVDPDVQEDAAAYSLDGGWAFVVGAGGTLVLMDARTGAVRHLDAGLTAVYQLAVRG